MQLLYINILFPTKNYLYSGCELVLLLLYLQPNITTMGQIAFEQLRLQAEQNNLGDLTLEDINEEIRLARSERHAKEARNPR